MARIKFGGIVSSINGSIGGTTFQRNRYGFTVKQKPNIVRPQKPRQLIRQRQVSEVSREWAERAQGVRDAWNSYAELYPIPSRLNPDAYLDGYAYYLRYREYCKIGNVSGVGTNPIGTRKNIENIVTTANYEDQELILDIVADDFDSDVELLIYASNAVPLGNTYKKTPLRYIQKVTSAQAGLSFSLDWSAVFGIEPFNLITMDLQYKFVNKVAGQVSIFPKVRTTFVPF